MSVDWRQWLYDQAITVFDPNNVYAAGSLKGSPAVKPFLVIRIEDELKGPIPNIRTQDTILFIHDDPGSFRRIDELANDLEEAINNGPAVQHFVAPVFVGVSGDLADDTYGTIFRSLAYRLHGRQT